MATAALCQLHSSSSSSLCHVSSSSSSPSSSSAAASVCGRVSCRAPQPQVHLSVSASSPDKTIFQIENSGVIACLRAKSAEVAYEVANAAIAGGISVLEIVVSTPGVFEVLNQLVKEHPTMALGVGTVLRIEDAKAAVNAGAKFLMSPAIVKDVMYYIQNGEVLYIPGTMTPTEILSACEAGAKIVKIYPVSALGGFQYISAIKKPFPHVSMVASQGINIDSIEEYISRGASAVVLSDAIFDKEAIAQRNYEKIQKLAHSAALLGNKAVNR
ncbi:hypothetical protein HN51_006171 [Arachis hypogaea]|uniref:KHG/KDPG aldolase n=1 Tax=Arachis hypogaea TaxID=3818 RepID=A0A445DBS3_ARAHY|nr:uncharacterized protein LOC112797758 isoform X2 [Arachis hypogaea]QHO09304.1 KHG/KDPG aldolase [Arachis hypogaea]RYR60634.1 hypothetical protein Ahy_A04g017690 isoform B [Arachis hypogaea]